MKVNKLSGANIEYDSDANLFRIIDGDVTITQFGNMIQKIYCLLRKCGKLCGKEI